MPGGVDLAERLHHHVHQPTGDEEQNQHEDGVTPPGPARGGAGIGRPGTGGRAGDEEERRARQRQAGELPEADRVAPDEPRREERERHGEAHDARRQAHAHLADGEGEHVEPRDEQRSLDEAEGEQTAIERDPTGPALTPEQQARHDEPDGVVDRQQGRAVQPAPLAVLEDHADGEAARDGEGEPDHRGMERTGAGPMD